MANGTSRGGSGSEVTRQVAGIVLSLAVATASTWLMSRLLRMLDPTRPDARAVARKKREISDRLGRPNVVTNSFEDVIALDVVNADQISTTFADVGGLEATKEALRELVVQPFLRPDLFQGGLLRPCKGVLLYGPPGTGKTMLARAVAKESGAVFLNVRLSTLQSKWFGDAQRLVHAVFTLAWKLAPSIIFIDEVDAFLSTRKSSDQEPVNSMKTEFMTMWDGMLTSADAMVTVLAATNRPWDVDEAILRRLPRSFEVPLPGAPERAGILRTILRGEHGARGFDVSTAAGSPLHRIARATPGFSGSDLRELCRQAAYCPVREMLREELPGPPRPLQEADFVACIPTASPTRDAARSYHRRHAAAASSSAAASGADGIPAVDIASLIEVLASVSRGRRQPRRRARGDSDASSADEDEDAAEDPVEDLY